MVECLGLEQLCGGISGFTPFSFKVNAELIRVA